MNAAVETEAKIRYAVAIDTGGTFTDVTRSTGRPGRFGRPKHHRHRAIRPLIDEWDPSRHREGVS